MYTLILCQPKAFKLLLTEKGQVEGLPLSVRSLAAQQAVEEGNSGATPEEGPWVVTLSMPVYLPVMQHLRNREIREKLYRAYVTRASSGSSDNTPVLQRILVLKQASSKMLVRHICC